MSQESSTLHGLVGQQDTYPVLPGVRFDADRVTLEGIYPDDFSLFRAKKNWSDILEYHFLLDSKRDFNFRFERDLTLGVFTLRCEFQSACGRYAFWRLTNYQAPEAQYQIETAHIPDSKSRQYDLLSAPDLKPVNPEPSVLGHNGMLSNRRNKPSLISWLKRVISSV